jgi:Flp pilus assembly protein TadD
VEGTGSARPDAGPVYRALFLLSLLVFAGSLLLGGGAALRVWGAPPSIMLDPTILAKKHHVEGDLDRAEREYRAASTIVDLELLDPTDELEDIYRRRGDREAIVRLHRERVSSRPFDAHRRLALGQALLDAGRADEGIEILEKLRRLAPRYPDPLGPLGFAYLETGRAAEAETVFREGLRWNPLDSSLHMGLGLALSRRGTLGEAELELDRALQIDPGNDAAREHLRQLQDRRSAAP